MFIKTHAKKPVRNAPGNLQDSCEHDLGKEVAWTKYSFTNT